eukprot:766813-Hanusia_phi.AAC.5
MSWSEGWEARGGWLTLMGGRALYRQVGNSCKGVTCQHDCIRLPYDLKRSEIETYRTIAGAV